MKSEADVTSHVESQTADLEFALRTLIVEPPSVRLDRVGVVGYSFGARSAVLATTNPCAASCSARNA
jgi:dienelactone hydrolase